MTRKIPTFYDPAQVSRPNSYSPSAQKPAALIARWQGRALPIEIIAPTPVSREQLALAHQRRYVDGVLDLEIRNGFGGRDAAVAASLPWTTGSLLAAARSALSTGSVAVSPSSGFHHAGYNTSGGFCTFNGLMISALVLRSEGLVRKVAILDCDQHYGNGTEDIIDTLKLREFVRHVTAGRGYPRDPAKFLRMLPELVASFSDCDLILYQAGADPHVDDPLGGWLTTEELYERDYHVFAAAHRHRLPIAWNLAGGYQEPIEKVLEIHDNTLHACADVYLEGADHGACP